MFRSFLRHVYLPQFRVQENCGQSTPTLWTLSPTGERYFGCDLLDAILFCAGFAEGHSLKPGKVRYFRFDREIGEEVEAIGKGYPELAGKKVGLVLQREFYTTKTGKEGSRLSIVGAFDPVTRQTFAAQKPSRVSSAAFGLERET